MLLLDQIVDLTLESKFGSLRWMYFSIKIACLQIVQCMKGQFVSQSYYSRIPRTTRIFNFPANILVTKLC